MRYPLRPALLAQDEKLAAPDGPVEPVARPVPRDPQRRELDVVLGHAAPDVGHVVLDLDEGLPERSGVLGGGVVGVGVAHDHGGLPLVELGEVANRPEERPAGLGRVQIADVLAQEHLAADRQGHGVLEVPADGQPRFRARTRARSRARAGGHGPRLGQRDGQRRVAPGPPQHDGPPVDHPDHGVVAGAGDGTVVHQEEIRDAL